LTAPIQLERLAKSNF